MKNHFLLLFTLLFALQGTFAQSGCSAYYPLVDGASFQYSTYDKKGKEEGQVQYRVTDVVESGDQVTATMVMELSDQKGNIHSSSYDISCDGNLVRIDFKSMLNEQMLGQFGDVEMDLTGTDVELPNNLSVGQELPDSNVHLKMKMGGTIGMNMNVETFNRKVEKKEQITTPGGTFDCYVIYSETRTKMMMTNQVLPSRVWLAEGVGMVKQESYNKAGKLVGSTLLTEFKN